MPTHSDSNPTNPPVLELRVALTTVDFERSVGFYCDGLGLEPAAMWPEEHGRAMMLELGRGTLELFDERQATTVDRIEVGQRVSGAVRFALRVPDLDAAMERLLAHGDTLYGASTPSTTILPTIHLWGWQ